MLMARPAGLGVSVRGESVYVTGWLDQSVSVFDRAANGHLTYVDRVRNGERMLSWFRDASEDTLIPASVLSASSASMNLSSNVTADPRPKSYPVRLGGHYHPIWHFTSRDSEPFVMNGEQYLAVAASDKLNTLYFNQNLPK